MKTKTFSPEEVLMAVIEYYANHECKDFEESVEAFFIDDDGTVEIEITVDDDAPKKTPKKSLN